MRLVTGISIVLLTVLVALMAACASPVPPTVESTPNIDATVEAKVDQALAKISTVTPMPTPTPIPTATKPPSPTATPNIQATVEAQVLALIGSLPTATPYPTYTPIPKPTSTPTPIPTPTRIKPTFTPFPTMTPTPRPTATPTIRAGVGWRQADGGAAITLHEVKTVGRNIVRIDFTIENTGYVEFTYNPLDTSIQTYDGMRYTYDSDAYTEEMSSQVWLPSIYHGGVLRRSEGYMIPTGSRVSKFFYEHPDRDYPDFIFYVD